MIPAILLQFSEDGDGNPVPIPAAVDAGLTVATSPGILVLSAIWRERGKARSVRIVMPPAFADRVADRIKASAKAAKQGRSLLSEMKIEGWERIEDAAPSVAAAKASPIPSSIAPVVALRPKGAP